MPVKESGKLLNISQSYKATKRGGLLTFIWTNQ